MTARANDTALMAEVRDLIAFYDARGANWEAALAFTLTREIFGRGFRVHSIDGWRCSRYPKQPLNKVPVRAGGRL